MAKITKFPNSLFRTSSILLLLIGCTAITSAEYSWEQAPAKVLPTGALEWAPEPFAFESGSVVRYIDFEDGDDSNSGETRDQAWKHHPWDVQATGNPADYHVPGTTYVFKGGVPYRGSLIAEERAPAHQPTRLTADPDWGEGPALFYSSNLVTDWSQGTDHPDIPEPGNVWVAEVDYLPNHLWLVQDGDKITRLKLARTPNWEIKDKNNVFTEWFTWDRTAKTGPIPGDEENEAIIAEDDQLKSFSAEELEDAIIWTKWGFVMGTPIPTRILGADVEAGEVAFKGIYYGNANRAQRVEGGHPYYLENKPHFLDQAGEYWAEKLGENRARLYLRLEEGQNPGQFQIEAARWYSPIESTHLQNVVISNLTFRFNNRDWDYTRSGFFHKEINTAGIRLMGSAHELVIKNCNFEHLTTAIWVEAQEPTENVDGLSIRDNRLLHIDNKGIVLNIRHNESTPSPFARNVKILRNKIEHIGMRTERLSNGAAIDVHLPDTAEIAGNILHRVSGPGIFVFGGKKSGQHGEAPFTRILIHHNSVIDSLLTSDDWGGIETWQGGPVYTWNNVSGNAGPGHFAHAYYIDGGFKNYMFNNIAWGISSDRESGLANFSAFQGIFGFRNTFLNNTAFRFRQGSRQQRPEFGRNQHLGNIWQDISQWVFYYGGRPRGQAADPNQMHVPEDEGNYAYETLAWARNVFYDISGRLGVFEETGRFFNDVEAFNKALEQRGTLSWDVGRIAKSSPLRDPENYDFRPTADGAAIDYGAITFIPWSLYGTVGEWSFTENRKDPSVILDEHWYMTRYHIDRTDYMNQPVFPLQGVGIQAEDYVDGPLENWTQGALRLNGKDQYLTLEHDATVGTRTVSHQQRVPGGWAVVEHPEEVSLGDRVKLEVTLPNDIDMGRRILVRMGYGIAGGWGGVYAETEPQDVTGPGPYEFEIETPTQGENGEEVRSLVPIVTYSKTGGTTAEDIVREGTLSLGIAEENPNARTTTSVLDRYRIKEEISGRDFRSPQIYDTNMILEAYLKVEPGSSGVLVQKWDTAGESPAGYKLSVLEDGRVHFVAGRGQPHDRPEMVSRTSIADGQWHHLLVEMDRTSRRNSIYINGKPDAFGPGLYVQSIANEADFYVGGTPEGNNLAVTLEFLRIAQGTLEDSQTTIDELYQWQFHGPQYRDFNGNPRGATPDAGAIEHRN